MTYVEMQWQQLYLHFYDTYKPKDMIKTFIHKHTDLIEILIAGGGGFSLMLTNIELILKVLIGFTTLGYILYKWRCNYIDRKNRNGKI